MIHKTILTIGVALLVVAATGCREPSAEAMAEIHRMAAAVALIWKGVAALG